ncbi:MAG: NAD-dependent epimerase/dehydratase family protein [Puniceicoccaceae bacterium]
MSSPEGPFKLPCPAGDVDSFLSRPQAGTLAVLQELSGDILVLGAGGKMGLHLCRMLREGLDRFGKSNTVYAASRFQTLASREAYEEAGLKVLVGDFRDPEFVHSLPDCPVVFYLVGAKFGTTGNPELLQQINVEVSRQVAERFKDSRIVAFSTGCVYSYTTPESGGSTEESPTEPVGEYALSCLGREEAFNEASKRHGTPVVHIRLNYSVEFRYGVPVDICRKVMAGEPIDLSMGYVNIIWQNDAVNQIIQCLSLAGSPPVPINITGQDIVPVREIASRFGELLGKEPVFTGTEEPTAWLSNASKSHRLFGPPSVGLDNMVEWIAAWLQNEGETYNKPTGFERRDGKF